MWMCLKWIYFDILLVKKKKKKKVVLFNQTCYCAISWWFLFSNNSSSDNKAPRHVFPFEFTAEKIPCLKHLEIDFHLITCIFEVDSCFLNTLMVISVIAACKCFSGSERFWQERSPFPAKMYSNDTLHLGRFFYWSMFYSLVTRLSIGLFNCLSCYHINLEVQQQRFFYYFLLCFGDPKKESARETEEKCENSNAAVSG